MAVYRRKSWGIVEVRGPVEIDVTCVFCKSEFFLNGRGKADCFNCKGTGFGPYKSLMCETFGLPHIEGM